MRSSSGTLRSTAPKVWARSRHRGSGMRMPFIEMSRCSWIGLAGWPLMWRAAGWACAWVVVHRSHAHAGSLVLADGHRRARGPASCAVCPGLLPVACRCGGSAGGPLAPTVPDLSRLMDESARHAAGAAWPTWWQAIDAHCAVSRPLPHDASSSAHTTARPGSCTLPLTARNSDPPPSGGRRCPPGQR
jgi:hypothetical protein